MPLVDVARASLSEVENYERVQIQIPSGIQVASPAVTDTVHLLAELIENAISFSPRESKVQVSSQTAEGGVLVTINDQGIGMSPEELGEANWRLANPPVVDVAVSRRMGLFVVGRLALRHGVRVQLKQRERGGLSAMVLLPATLLIGGQGSVPNQRSQYDAFTSFDPSQFDSAAAAANGSVFPAPSSLSMETKDVRGSDSAPLDTQWPGTIPAPGGEGWPSYPEPGKQDWPPFTEQPAARPAGRAPLAVLRRAAAGQPRRLPLAVVRRPAAVGQGRGAALAVLRRRAVRAAGPAALALVRRGPRGAARRGPVAVLRHRAAAAAGGAALGILRRPGPAGALRGGAEPALRRGTELVRRPALALLRGDGQGRPVLPVERQRRPVRARRVLLSGPDRPASRGAQLADGGAGRGVPADLLLRRLRLVPPARVRAERGA
ncbi:sensor histidine kinase [Nonomuraea ferruginea]